MRTVPRNRLACEPLRPRGSHRTVTHNVCGGQLPTGRSPFPAKPVTPHHLPPARYSFHSHRSLRSGGSVPPFLLFERGILRRA
jgi:hypothetical protein